MHDMGVLCLAQNNSSTDYVRLAYLQCLSLKLTNPMVPYALVTDSADTLTDTQKSCIDHLIILPVDWAKDQEWKQRNDWQLGKLSPFKETIKVEADLLFTRDISHWWRMLRHRDVVLSTGCKDYQGQQSKSRAYRKTFDINGLPDIYSGLMYWRRSIESANFFTTVKRVYQHWPIIQESMQQCNDPGSNDMVYAVACLLHGVENVTLPAADFFNFAHMKPAINRLAEACAWHASFTVDVVPPDIRVAGNQQMYPFHYYDKNWPTDSLIEEYEHARLRISKSS